MAEEWDRLARWDRHARWAPERHREDPRRGWEGVRPVVRWWTGFRRARGAVVELYWRFGWGPVVVGPLTAAHRLSGCEQTLLVVLLLSHRDPAAVDGACAGIAAALEEIEEGAVPKSKVKGATKRFPHGKSVKHSRIYDALIAEGMPKSQAAAISNAATPKHSNKGKKGKRR